MVVSNLPFNLFQLILKFTAVLNWAKLNRRRLKSQASPINTAGPKGLFHSRTLKDIKSANSIFRTSASRSRILLLFESKILLFGNVFFLSLVR